MNEWISVIDRLPEYKNTIDHCSRYVLIWDCKENDVYTACYRKIPKYAGHWIYSVSGDIWPEIEVSHWMELPEPPKEDIKL